MYQLKTTKREGGVEGFLAAIEDEGKRSDARRLVELMRKVSGAEPAMWGSSIVGFGEYRYRYASGHEGACCRLGFSPRAKSLSLYLYGLAYDETGPAELLARLGKHERGKGCLYLKRLDDAEPAALEQLLALAWASPAMGELPA